jgi:hypothetical protein
MNKSSIIFTSMKAKCQWTIPPLSLSRIMVVHAPITTTIHKIHTNTGRSNNNGVKILSSTSLRRLQTDTKNILLANQILYSTNTRMRQRQSLLYRYIFSSSIVKAHQHRLYISTSSSKMSTLSSETNTTCDSVKDTTINDPLVSRSDTDSIDPHNEATIDSTNTPTTTTALTTTPTSLSTTSSITTNKETKSATVIKPVASNPTRFRYVRAKLASPTTTETTKVVEPNRSIPLVHPSEKTKKKQEKKRAKKLAKKQSQEQSQDHGKEQAMKSFFIKRQSLGDHCNDQGDTTLPSSTWVHVQNISPVSSLDPLLDGIQKALDIEEQIGIIDLDCQWSTDEPIPIIQFPNSKNATTSTTTNTNTHLNGETETMTTTPTGTPSHKWVRKAKLILSPFARPSGWYLKFDNRSIVYALLRHAKEHSVRATWRTLQLKEYTKNHCHSQWLAETDTSKSENYDSNHNTDLQNDDPFTYGNHILNDDISDSTVRVENCPPNISETSVLNFFSRYDLKPSVGKNHDKPIQLWHGCTTDGKVCKPTTYLIHFADPSWARAALREKQGTYMSQLAFPYTSEASNQKPLYLVQYPRQIL